MQKYYLNILSIKEMEKGKLFLRPYYYKNVF